MPRMLGSTAIRNLRVSKGYVTWTETHSGACLGCVPCNPAATNQSFIDRAAPLSRTICGRSCARKSVSGQVEVCNHKVLLQSAGRQCTHSKPEACCCLSTAMQLYTQACNVLRESMVSFWHTCTARRTVMTLTAHAAGFHMNFTDLLKLLVARLGRMILFMQCWNARSSWAEVPVEVITFMWCRLCSRYMHT